MRIVLLTAAAGLAALSAVSAAAGDYPAGYGSPGYDQRGYGASYGQGNGWDVPPVPLNVPDAEQQGGDRGAWRGHDHYAGADHRPVQRGYARLQRGYAMPRFWMNPDYEVTNWGFYGLSQPPRGCHWVRYYDEAVLVDEGGRVVQMVDDLDWDQPMAARGEREDRVATYDQKYGGMAPGSYYAPPSTEVIAPPPPRMVPPPPHRMPPPVVAWSAPPPPVTWTAPGTTVVVQSPTVVTTTTTTTTTYVEETARPRPVAHHVWHRPVRRVVTCCCLCTR